MTLACLNGNAPFLLHGSQPLPEGVIVCSLAEALEQHPELRRAAPRPARRRRRPPLRRAQHGVLAPGRLRLRPARRRRRGADPDRYFVSSFNDNGAVPLVSPRPDRAGRAAQATVVETFGGLPVHVLHQRRHRNRPRRGRRSSTITRCRRSRRRRSTSPARRSSSRRKAATSRRTTSASAAAWSATRSRVLFTGEHAEAPSTASTRRRHAAHRQPHGHRPRPAATAPATSCTRASSTASRAASSTARSSSARTPRRPTPSRRTRRSCSPTTRRSTPSRSWRSSPTT